MSDVTRSLTAIDRGDENAGNELLPLVYQELQTDGCKTGEGEAGPDAAADDAGP